MSNDNGIQTVYDALLHLSDADPDHASEDNGVGFNGRDSDFGNSLAAQIRAGRTLSPKQLLAALKMLRTYKTQLGRAGLFLPERLNVSIPPPPNQMSLPLNGTPPPRPAPPPTSIRLISGDLHVKTPYKERLVVAFKDIRLLTSSTGWNPNEREWVFKLSALPMLTKALDAEGIAIPNAITEFYNTQQKDGKLPISIPVKSDSGKQFVFTKPPRGTFNHPELLELADRYMNDLPQKPYQHQRDYVHWCIENGSRGICAMDVGTGKTYAALIAAHIGRLATPQTERAPLIVVAPVSLKRNWYDEAARLHLDIEAHSWAKIPQIFGDPFILIADEVHYIQHMKSQRTQKTLALATHELCAGFQGLTGTPCPNGRPAGLFPLLKASRHWLAANRKAYEITFCNAGPTRWSKWDISGTPSEGMLRRLYEMTGDVLFRRSKRDCLDLPPLTRSIKPVDVSANAAAAYEQTFERLRADWTKRVRDGLISGNNEALVMLGQLRHAASVAKVEWTADQINALTATGNQVIAAFGYKDALYSVKSALQCPCEVIEGDTDSKDRQPIVDRFQNGITQVVLATYGAGGVGLNMQAGDYVLLHDRPWRPGDVEQIEGRAWRAGRQLPVISLWPQYNDVDSSVDAVLTSKQQAVDLVVDGKVTAGNMGVSVIIDGQQTILPDANSSFNRIARDLLEALFAKGHKTPQAEADDPSDELTEDPEEPSTEPDPRLGRESDWNV